MLDVELSFGRDVDAFASNLDFELIAAFQSVGESTEFFDELRERVILLDVAFWFLHKAIEWNFTSNVQRQSSLQGRGSLACKSGSRDRKVSMILGSPNRMIFEDTSWSASVEG